MTSNVRTLNRIGQLPELTVSVVEHNIVIVCIKEYRYYYSEQYRPICIMVKVFAYGPGDLGSIPGQVIPKTQKIVLDTSLLNTQHYKV